MAYKLNPKEKNRQDELYKVLGECIENYKVIVMNLKWANRRKEKILFDPYLLGEDNSYSIRSLFVYGKNVIFSTERSYNFKFIASIEISVSFYSVKNQIIEFHPRHRTILKHIPELQLLQNFPTQEIEKKVDVNDEWKEPEYIKKPCIICGSEGKCKHFSFLSKHYKEVKSRWEEDKKYSQLLKETIDHHPKFRVITYKSKEESKEFSVIENMNFTEFYFALYGEWSQSPNHSADLNFLSNRLRIKNIGLFFLKTFFLMVFMLS